MIYFDSLIQNLMWWPIIQGTLVYMVVATLWYSPLLFGDEWLQKNRMKRGEVDDFSLWAYPLLGSVLIGFMMSLGLAFALAACKARDFTSCIIIAFTSGLLFAIPPTYSGTLWGKKSFNVFAIDAGKIMIFLLITAAMFSWYK